MNNSMVLAELHNKGAEDGVVGGLLINPDAYYTAVQYMDADDFYIQTNRYIFEAIGALHDANKDIDIVMVQNQLIRDGHEDVTPAMVTRIMNNVPSSMHVKSYAQECREWGDRRRVVLGGQQALQMAFDLSTPLNVADAHDRMYASARVMGKSAELWTGALDEFHTDLIDRMETPYQDVWGMSYGGGFTKLNRATGGAHPSEFVIVAGEPGIGKSVVVGDWTAQFSLQDYGAVYSMEMPANTWIRRHVSREAHESARNLMRGELDDVSGVMSAIDSLRNRKIFLSDHEEWSSDELRSDLIRLKHKHNIQWAVIDHMGLLSDAGDDIAESTRVAQRLRKTARKLDIHIMTIAPVTKDGMQGAIPNMSNVRGSGEVLHEADVVYWVNPFTAMSQREKEQLKSQPAEQRYQTLNRCRTFFILKGRHLTNSNMHTHLAFAEERPTLAETEPFPRVEVHIPEYIHD